MTLPEWARCNSKAARTSAPSLCIVVALLVVGVTARIPSESLDVTSLHPWSPGLAPLSVSHVTPCQWSVQRASSSTSAHRTHHRLMIDRSATLIILEILREGLGRRLEQPAQTRSPPTNMSGKGRLHLRPPASDGTNQRRPIDCAVSSTAISGVEFVNSS